MSKAIWVVIYLALYGGVFLVGYLWAIYAPAAAVWIALTLASIAAAWLGINRWRKRKATS